MSDRELLEKAAKAAGIVDAQWDDEHGWMHIPDPSRAGLQRRAGDRVLWQPLTDDGDALRLAVKLRMAMDVGEYGLVAFCGQGLDREVMQQDIDGDPYASTRRAIVRAAAAIGEQA